MIVLQRSRKDKMSIYSLKATAVWPSILYVSCDDDGGAKEKRYLVQPERPYFIHCKIMAMNCKIVNIFCDLSYLGISKFNES